MSLRADLGVLFAGGAGQRMGGADKGEILFGNETLAARALGRLAIDAEAVAVSGRVQPSWLEGSAAAFIPDVEGLGARAPGPAGGLLSALEWAAARYPAEARIFTIPVDVPFFPEDLCARLMENLGAAPGIVVRQGAWLHPVFGLWRAGSAPLVRKLVAVDKVRAMHTIAERAGAACLDVEASPHAFLNINTPDDLARAESLLDQTGRATPGG